MREHLPLLDGLRIAAPCKAAWTEMAGDDRVRFCGQCRKNVYDLTALTRDDAERLILAHEGQLCAHFLSPCRRHGEPGRARRRVPRRPAPALM